jgi:hypothetical protein
LVLTVSSEEKLEGKEDVGIEDDGVGGPDTVFCGKDEVAETIEVSIGGVTEIMFMVHGRLIVLLHISCT